MKLYVHMMLGGSICTPLYILFNHVLPCELPLKWRRIFLRANIALYLIPVPMFAAQMKKVFQALLDKAGVVFWEDGRSKIINTTSIWDNLVVVNEKGKLLYITGYQDYLPIIGIALAVFLILAFGWLALYLKTCRRLKRTAVMSAEIPAGSAEADLQKKASRYFGGFEKRAKTGGRKVQIGFSPCTSSPLTVGILHPIILLPEGMKSDADSGGGEYASSVESIIRHEFNHICGWDMLGRFFAFIVVAVEWFNPLSWYLLREEIAVSEMLCDMAAVGGRTKKEKSDYIRCVMETVQKKGDSGMLAASLASSGSLLEERVKRIIGKNAKRYWKRGIAAAIMAASFLVSCIPALAYQMPGKFTVTEKSYAMDEGWENVDRVVFIAGEDIEKAYQEFRHRELLFMGDNGRICCMDSFEMENKNENWEKESCRHDYKPGIVAQHIRTSYGGCIVATWEAEGCAGCGDVIATGARLATAGGLLCPHFSE